MKILTRQDPFLALLVVKSKQSCIEKEDLTTSVDSLDEEKSTNSIIVDGLHSFFVHHESHGGRAKEQKDALDAVATAALFSGDIHNGNNPCSVRLVLERLGVYSQSNRHFDSAVKRAEQMKRKQETFKPDERAKQPDSLEIEAKICVDNYCHSEEGSRADTDSKRCFIITDPETN